MRALFFEEDLSYFLPNIIYLTLYKAGFEGDGLLKQKDGRGIFVHLVTASFKEEGETYLVFSFQEIQRLKRLEREKLEMKRRTSLGMMVEEISHQVRHPVASIGGFTKRLMKPSLSSSRKKVYLRRILQETERLEEIVRRIEDLADTPRPVFRKENVREMVEQTLQAISGLGRSKDVAFNLAEGSFGGDECFYMDKGLITRALVHLLENSIESVSHDKGKKDRGKIRVDLACDEDHVDISVSDRGEGISKKNFLHILEPFFSTRPDRVGLGLTFVRRVVEDHGGKIRIESRLRRGTTVTLTFPRDRRRPIRREWISPETPNFLSSLQP